MSTRILPRLNQTLPPDVEVGGFSRFAFYQRYAAFTWPWFVRRALVFWPFAVIYGLFGAVWHASAMGAWADVGPLGSRGVLAAVVGVSAGPLVAVGVRALRLPYALERLLVVLAIFGGLFVAAGAGAWVDSYHHMLMVRLRGGGMTMAPPAAVEDISRALGHLMGRLPQWIGIFLVGGGLELSSYVTERRRLAERERRHDLDTLLREKAEADLRLAVLQAQIEPHFLFNTLASVSALISIAPERAAATVDALADYLRSTLPKFRQGVGGPSATLGEQTAICLRYLALMNIRMGGRITVREAIDPALAAAAFPPLLLISLVENAVKHGIEPKAGPGLVAISARRTRDGRLEVAVEDDGAGLSAAPGGGLGLANVREQLRHRFGERAALTVEAAHGGGVIARIVLPMGAS